MTRSDVQDLEGLLVVDKPAGMTSHDVVSRVRRLIGMKRVGHGGTLDPFATGVLVIGVGRATRVLQLVQDSDKTYHALVALGATTDTADVEGSLLRHANPQHWPGRETVLAALASHVGAIDQVPPVFSAIKVDGRKLYELARAGVDVDVPARRVTIHAIELLAYEPPWLEISVVCGKGTYIRSLARDIGEQLGTGGYCHALRRVTNGPFCLEDAWTLDALSILPVRSEWPQIALHADAALVSLPVVILSEVQSGAWYHGRPVKLTHSDDAPSMIRVYDADGRFAGVGAMRDGAAVPTMVQPRPAAGEDVNGDALAVGCA